MGRFIYLVVLNWTKRSSSRHQVTNDDEVTLPCMDGWMDGWMDVYACICMHMNMHMHALCKYIFKKCIYIYIYIVYVIYIYIYIYNPNF